MSVNSCVVFVGGIVGAEIAPVENLATLPVASSIVGTACLVVPVTLTMRKIGRKSSFFLIIGISILNAIFCGYSIYLSSFWLFCASCFLFGMTSACVMQFRFAAMESVNINQIPQAASSVLLGGIAAAFIGPEIAVAGRDLILKPFVGSFLLLGVLFLISLLVLAFFTNPKIPGEQFHGQKRSLMEISKQPVFWVAILSAAVGYMVMSFIMTATPVSMHVMDGHSLQNTKWVIQSHIVAMFLPSLFTALIIKWIGVKRMMMGGLMAYIICIAIAYSGHHLGNYWISLILLGIGWNFLFVGGTTLLPLSYRPEERFKVQAMNDFVVFGTQAVAAVSAGWFVFTLGWETLLLVTLPIIFLQIVTIAVLGKGMQPSVTKVE